MKELEIPRAEWTQFIESFDRQHHHWLTTIRVYDGQETAEIMAKEVPLESVSIDRNGEIRICVDAKHGSSQNLEHVVVKPNRLLFDEAEDGGHKGIRIESATGSATNLEFRVAVLPESVDGIN